MSVNYKSLNIWQKAVKFVEVVYAVTAKFPKKETYALCDQIQRSVVSIPSNIAEGSQRGSKADFMRFLYIAKGSAAELETQLLIAYNLKYMEEADLKILQNEIDHILRMISSFMRYVKEND